MARDLQSILRESASHHDHLCPRQILGARLGLAGMDALGFSEAPAEKRLLIITESDGCFADGLSAATACSIGHRTLRVEDYGKTAATFMDVQTGKTVRIAPDLKIRQRAFECTPNESRHYFAQMQAYQTMPDEQMFTITPVRLKTSIQALISRPGVRVNCTVCGEEIINEREIHHDGIHLCRSCAGDAYYDPLDISAL